MNFEEAFEKVKTIVEAAEGEAVMAAMFHETWKPAAFDKELTARMGTSFATHSFNIVRIALRREMILSLMRIWDSNPKALRMTVICENLKDDVFFRRLVAKRAASLGMASASIEAYMAKSMEPRRAEVLSLIRRYTEGGSGYGAFRKLRALRDKRLAHRQTNDLSTAVDNPEDNEVETFYKDSLSVVTLLLSLVLGRAFNLDEAGDVYRHHAKFFWVSVRGECTEGHPYYRKPT